MQAHLRPPTPAPPVETCQGDECVATWEERGWIIGAYAVIAVIWCIIVHVLGIAPWHTRASAHGLNGSVGWFVFFIPIIVMGLAVISVIRTPRVCDVKNSVRGGNALYLGVLVAIPLFAILDASYRGDRTQFTMVILVAMTLAVLSQLDIWGSDAWTCIIQHAESALKTLAVGLLLFVLALYAYNGKYITTS